MTGNDATLSGPLLRAGCELVVTHQLASATYLHRKLGIPFDGALALIAELERAGVIEPHNGMAASRGIRYRADQLRDALAALEGAN
ncbi:hypothetical protein Back2_17640 [Nocardioides baekrokdamisoli]|uniref:FtsK gamma domain-containing protein n=1 Tax=Nocardioides baekrokdamisoli TaxID=1804624 RepID=A0A3G9IEX3_9ACTN|nr:DNA translocase FtsK [Nocardioides baekrokdamisoli]BBH17477.1 hypothetical protein Back2_17640 [Nocardioides baekrokdamisoli]